MNCGLKKVSRLVYPNVDRKNNKESSVGMIKYHLQGFITGFFFWGGGGGGEEFRKEGEGPHV